MQIYALFALTLSISIPQLIGQTVPASDNFVSLAARADEARDSNRLEEAAALYRKSLRLRPTWAEGWWSLGTIFYDTNHYGEAASAFQRLIALRPSNGTAFAMLGLSEFELDRDEQALSHIQKSEVLGVDQNAELRSVLLYHHGVLLQRKGMFHAAQETLQQLCAQGVHSREISQALGKAVLRQSGKKSLQYDGDGQIVLAVGQAACLAGEKKFDEARLKFTALASQSPRYPKMHYAFGLFLLDASDVPAAIDQFKMEIERDPADVVSRLEIAAASYKINSSAGVPFVEEALKLDPHQPFAHMLLGLLRLDMDDYLEAIPELEIARKGLPTEPRIHAALASAYARAGRRKDAELARASFARLTQEEETRTAQAKTGKDAAPCCESRIPVSDLPSESR